MRLYQLQFLQSEFFFLFAIVIWFLVSMISCNIVLYFVMQQRVLSAYEFELHAGAKTKHPNNHIFLENGRAVYSIVQELKTAPHCVFEDVIRNVAGSALCEEGLQAWKGDGQVSRLLILLLQS